MINVSVIISTFKRTSETIKCLNFLKKSDGLNRKFVFEIVIVDSSPTNELKNELKIFDETFKIKYIYLKKQTLPGKARNLAVKNTNNELIISLDSDIEFVPETAWGLISFMKDHPYAAKATGTSIFSSGDNKGKIDRPTKWDRIYNKYNTDFVEGIYGRYEIFYKTTFLNVGGYDELFEFCGEGTDMSIKMWRAGYPLAISKEIIAYHNSDAPESLRRSIPDKMAKMYLSLFLVAYKYDVSDVEESENFVNSYLERENAYGKTIEFHSIVSSAKSFEWVHKNYLNILKSKKNIPQKYKFKPFDVFSDKKLTNICLNNAKKAIKSSRKKVV